MDFIKLVEKSEEIFCYFLLFLLLGGVFLSVTGCEALFADLGEQFYADLFKIFH
jgi:hypothetical protein